MREGDGILPLLPQRFVDVEAGKRYTFELELNFESRSDLLQVVTREGKRTAVALATPIPDVWAKHSV